MFAALALTLAFGLPARAAKISIDPPPGWDDVTAAKGGGDVLISLKGPETSSFVLAKIAPMSLENRGAVRAFLQDVLTSVNERTGLGFAQSTNLNETDYDSGVRLYAINADYKGKPRLVLGVLQAGDDTLLATLISAVPDTLLPSIMNGLRGVSAGGRAQMGSKAASLDGQLIFELPAGFTTRPLAESERKMGFVLALRGYDSEMLIMKIADDSTAVKDQPTVVKDTVLSVGGVDKTSLSDLFLEETPAGPQLVYAWAKVRDDTGTKGQFSAGYLPWCYWGYSVLSKGPRAADLMTESFKNVALGDSALPKLVKETPRIPLTPELKLRGQEVPVVPAAAAAVAVLIVLVFILSGRRR